MLVASGAFFLTRVRMHRRVCERIRRQKRTGPRKLSESQSEDFKKNKLVHCICVPKASIVAKSEFDVSKLIHILLGSFEESGGR